MKSQIKPNELHDENTGALLSLIWKVREMENTLISMLEEAQKKKIENAIRENYAEQLQQKKSETRIDQSNERLTMRAINVLKSNNIFTLEQLTDITENELLKMPNTGRKMINEVKTFLESRGMHLKEEPK